MRFNYVMDCKEFVWILTNVSNTIIEKKLISLFPFLKPDTLLYPNSFLLKNTVHV